MIRIDAANSGDHNVPVLLQRGVYVERTGAATVLEFMCDLLGLAPEAIIKEVKTIMMDNSVVDDPASEGMGGAKTLVLSGAMPGLVGAMLRSDSPYKVMRSTITSSGTGNAGTPMIKIKLFNTVLKKYTPLMVRHGFWIEDDGA
ncbi:MAG: hypothetical protein JW852_07280 [Spirochaetales bacterium]|nr:hypothetical protein [Spirochaetales bacterium]